MTNESMKKVFQTKLTDTRATDVEGIGVIRFEGAKIYKWVSYNAGTGTVAAVAGSGCVYHGDDAVVANSAADVTMDYTDGLIGAGVLQAIIATTEFGWIQIKGIAVMVPSFTAGADGDRMTPIGAADGAFDVIVTGALTNPVGVALDISAKEILLDCPW
jgi:hypothetical protein